MYRDDAYRVLTSDKCGYSPDEASRILERAFTFGSAQTAPRACPSLWITVYDDVDFRICENDSGTQYRFPVE
jgi:hypothetical protein